MDISAKALPETVRFLLNIIPQEVLERINPPSAPNDLKGLPALVGMETRSHPLFLGRQALEREAHRSAADGTIQLSRQSAHLLNSLANLRTASEASDYIALVRRLISPTQYYSTLFEADVAAGYILAGNEVFIVPEDATSGLRSPDIRIRVQGTTVDIECKSLEDLGAREQNLWNHLQIRLTRILQRRRRPLRVSITAMAYLSGKASDAIARALEAHLRAIETVPPPIVVGDFSLRFDSVGSATDWTPVPPRSEGQPDRSWVEFEFSTRTTPPSFRMVTIIDVNPWRGENHLKRLFRLIDDASSQFAPEHPGIVHIQVPYRDGGRIEEVFDSCFNRIFGYLRKMRPAVNAVVLEGSSIDANAQNGDGLIQNAVAVIPNPNAATSLPEGFAILGSRDMGLNMVADGAMRIEFDSHSSASKQLGRHLYYHCSKNGYHQLRIGQSHRNQFRFDVVSSVKGRITKYYVAYALEEAGSHKLALRWHPEPIACALDGQMLMESV